MNIDSGYLKYPSLLIISLSLILFILPSISSDVISVNSGGSNQIIINPDTNIEGLL